MQNHNHCHNHSHTPKVTLGNEKKILLSFVLIFTFMIVEVIGGIYSGSLALLADAGHMLTDAAALALAYFAFRLGRRPSDNQRTFGYMRFEVIAGFINSITLIAIVFWILYEAWKRLQNPQEILSIPMFVVAVIGLLINLLVFWILTRGDQDHVNIKGAVLHVLGDLLGSVGAVIAAIIIYFTNWTPIDPILSVVVSLLVLRSAWGLLKESMHILLEGTPKNINPKHIKQHIEKNIPTVITAHHIHVWSITSGFNIATMHIQLKDNSLVKETILKIEQSLLEEFDIKHATIAIDWDDNNLSTCAL